ncbi:MAG: hypothetical protein H8E51_07065 [Bacteroidetes bacterium]|nr:hypothetical protein [Bacteroidota bacterium]
MGKNVRKNLKDIIEFSGMPEGEFFKTILNVYRATLIENTKRLKIENDYYTQQRNQNGLLKELGHQAMEVETVKRETRLDVVNMFFAQIAESNLTVAAKKKASELHVEFLAEFEKPKTEPQDDNPESQIEPKE